MTRLAKDGLRVHHIEKTSITDVVNVGETRTAICGVEWITSVVDPDELAELPHCYNCTEERYYRAYIKALLFKSYMDEYDKDCAS